YLSSQNLITPTPLEACKKKIVFLGTEITKANPDSTTGWKNNWGQAASTLENDYAHLVSNKLRKVVHSNYDLDQLYLNSEAWEKSTNTQVLETFFPDLIDRNADYIILQLGDKIINDNELAAFKTKYIALINWLKNNNISAKIVVLTSFYPNNKASKLNQTISEIASTSSVYGVDISNLQLIKINTQTLNNSQVVPSDSGMKLIADLIWEKIDPYPNCPIPKLSVSKTFICKGATTTLTATGCSGNILWTNGKEANPIYVEKGEYSAQCSQSTCKGINSPKISVFESQDCGATCDEGIAKPNAPSSYKGGIDINNCNIIEGWALNESGFGEASTVDIYIDNKKIASTIANLKYKDNGLGKAFFNDEANNRGFRYVLPDSVWYKDGTTRTVTAKFGGTSTFMFNFQPNQNNTINCPGKGLGYCGEKIIIIDSIPPISNRFSKSLIVYPNPTRGWVTVKVWEKKNEKGTLSVVDSNGRLIFEKTKDGKNDDLTFEFNFPKRYTAGTYFVKYNSSTQNDMKKIIFKR
nr:T9SS type A sorting domain-containing protein [Pseudarcicella sp.]